MNNPQAGQRVAYSAAFVRGPGGMSHEVGRLRGHIVEVKGKFGGHTLVKVLWDGEAESVGCLDVNLSRAEKGKPVQDVA